MPKPRGRLPGPSGLGLTAWLPKVSGCVTLPVALWKPRWICDFTAAQEAFRDEARAWLSANAPPPGSLPSLDTADGFEAHRAWEQPMFEDRWSVVTWPEEYGGRGVGILEWLIFEEEYWRAQAPIRVSQNGVFLLAPTMFEFGTDEQKVQVPTPNGLGRGDLVPGMVGA